MLFDHTVRNVIEITNSNDNPITVKNTAPPVNDFWLLACNANWSSTPEGINLKKNNPTNWILAQNIDIPYISNSSRDTVRYSSC